jgi:ferrochelatase
VLLIQLGTPDAPTADALRAYLRQFLSDRRVIEAPRLWWWLILNTRILRVRPKQSARKYCRIWDPKTGSPLLHQTKMQAEALQRELSGIPVRFAMQVGNPSVANVVHEIIQSGVNRLLVLPMYPQYSATTTASALDALFSALRQERNIPAVRTVPPYFGHPAYLDAVVSIIREELAKLTCEPDHYVLSFHGIPIKYAQRGDPYPEHVKVTAERLLEKLAWPPGRWTLAFQSLFGKEPWLRPYTEDVLRELAMRGARRVFIATPGFTADCLETIDEVGFELREIFFQAGGTELIRCPCLNVHTKWITGMKQLILEEGQGWLFPTTEVSAHKN